MLLAAAFNGRHGGPRPPPSRRYLGARTAASCGISLVVLVLSFFLHGSLLSVWLGMKVSRGSPWVLFDCALEGDFMFCTPASHMRGAPCLSPTHAGAPCPPTHTLQAINVTALALDLARFLRQPEPGGAGEQAGAPAAPPAKERQK